MSVTAEEVRQIFREEITALMFGPQAQAAKRGERLTLPELLKSGLLTGSGCESPRSVHRAIKEGRLRGHQGKPGAPWHFYANEVREDIALWQGGGRVAELLHPKRKTA